MFKLSANFLTFTTIIIFFVSQIYKFSVNPVSYRFGNMMIPINLTLMLNRLTAS